MLPTARAKIEIHKRLLGSPEKTFPISFIMFMPEGVPAHFKVMYTRPIPTLCETFKVNKHYTLEDPEDLDVEWLEDRIAGKN